MTTSEPNHPHAWFHHELRHRPPWLAVCCRPVPDQYPAMPRTQPERMEGVDVPREGGDEEREHGGGVQLASAAAGGDAALGLLQGGHDLVAHALLNALVDGRVEGLGEGLVGAEVHVRVHLGEGLERLRDDLGSDVMGLEQDGGVASDGEGQELRAAGVGLGEVGDVVHLRREGDAGRAGSDAARPAFRVRSNGRRDDGRARSVRDGSGGREGGEVAHLAANLRVLTVGVQALGHALGHRRRCVASFTHLVSWARARANAGRRMRNRRRLPASEIATSKIFLPVVSGFANPTSSMKIPARPGVGFETTPSSPAAE